MLRDEHRHNKLLENMALWLFNVVNLLFESSFFHSAFLFL